MGAVGEILGAIAVVLTLVYLANQLRENTKSLKVQSLESSFQDWNQSLAELQSPHGVGRALMKAQSEQELSKEEMHELGFWYRRVLNINDKVQYLHSIGAADSYNFDAFHRNMPTIVGNSFFVDWWGHHRGRYSERYQNYIDEFLKGNA